MKGFHFIPEMAVAVLRDVDPKWQTRRIIKLPMIDKDIGCELSGGEIAASARDTARHCNYKVGERRCLLTTWAVLPRLDDTLPTEIPLSEAKRFFWHAGMGEKPTWVSKSRPGRFLPNHLRPLMPVFEVVAVRAERVQEITAADAIAEGIVDDKMNCYGPACPPTCNTHGCFGTREEYKMLWNRINLARGFGWGVNPWVWVISFRRVRP